MRNTLSLLKILLWTLPLTCVASDLPKTLGGEAFDPLEAMASPVVVLFFVEEVCPISNRYVPAMNRMEKEWGGSGVDFFAVYPSDRATAESARAHQREFALSIPALLDAAHFLVRRSGVEVTPECAVFVRGPGGKARLVYRGRIDDQYAAFGKWRREATCHELADTLVALQDDAALAFRSEPAIGCYIAGGGQ